MALTTHGRWPLVAAGAALPVSAAAVQRPGLRPLAALLWHQSEEWVWPGGFLPWLNRELQGSDDDELPMTRRRAFFINVPVGWGLSVAAAAEPPVAAPAALLYVTHLGNAWLHVGWAATHRRYDPGLVTAVVTLLPAAVSGLLRLLSDPAVPRRSVLAGAFAGAAMSLGLPRLLQRAAAGPGAGPGR